MGQCLLCDAPGDDIRPDGRKVCEECSGTGKVPHWGLITTLPDEREPYPDKEDDCPHCNGTGYCPNYPLIAD